jgi:hypothetical protein
MFRDSIWENLFDLGMYSMMYYCGSKNGQERATQQYIERDNQKLIEDLRREVEELKRNQ